MARGSKRLRKKRKDEQTRRTLAKKYTPKEQKRLSRSERESKAQEIRAAEIKEAKRLAANEARRQNRAESKQALLKLGLSEKFINKHHLHNRKFSNYSSTDLRNFAKGNALENAGYTQYTKSDLRLSWQRLADKYPGISTPDKTLLTLDQAIYVGVAEVQGGFYPEDTSGMSVEELEHLIQNRWDEATESPDDSSGGFCSFMLKTGSLDDMEYQSETYYHRQAWEDHGYYKVTVSNRWSRHEFLSMAYNVVNHTKNEEVAPTLLRFKQYCHRNGVNWMDNIKNPKK